MTPSRTAQAKFVIALNGPPRSGKDEATKALSRILDPWFVHETMKFTAVVKDLTHRSLGLDCRHDAFEALKDVPLPEFGGLTPRQAYIAKSASEKAERGESAIADHFIAKMLESPARLVLNSDIGIPIEIDGLAATVGAENILLLRLHRTGHDFSKDNRTYLGHPDVETHDISNDSGLEDLADAVSGPSLDFLRERMPEAFLAKAV
jgi:hypothetical protein